MIRNGDQAFQFQGALDCNEAETILPRLEKEKIRFQIETDPTSHYVAPLIGDGVYNDNRIKLFVHADDIHAWQKIRNEYFPTQK